MADRTQEMALNVSVFERTNPPASSCRLTARSAELFALLVARPGGQQSRRAIIERLWGDVSWDVGRRRLNSTVYRLRSEIEAGDGANRLGSSSDGLWLQLCENDWVDLAEFDRAFKRATDDRPLAADEFRHLDAVVDLYKPRVLPSTNSDWVLALRSRLENQAIALRTRLAHDAVDRGELATALRHSRAVLALDELREDLHRVIIRCHLANGDRAAAGAHFEQLKQTLARELDTSPMPETTRLMFDAGQNMLSAATIGELEQSLRTARRQLHRLLGDIDTALGQLRL